MMHQERIYKEQWPLCFLTISNLSPAATLPSASMKKSFALEVSKNKDLYYANTTAVACKFSQSYIINYIFASFFIL